MKIVTPPPSQQFLEMRARIVSLAADFDRLERNGWPLVAEQVNQLHDAIAIVRGEESNRAARVQLIFSDPI